VAAARAATDGADVAAHGGRAAADAFARAGRAPAADACAHTLSRSVGPA